MKKRNKNFKFKAGISLIVVEILLVSSMSLVSGITLVNGDTGGIYPMKSLFSQQDDFFEGVDGSGYSALVPHLIFGTATWEGGGNAVGASVEVVSSLGTLTDTVGSGGEWQVDCGDPGPNWPSGTSFTVYVNGTGAHLGWYGSKGGSVSGNYNDMGNIVVYENDAPNNPSTPSGSTSGETGQSYSYSTSATDPNGDSVYYLFDWDDGTNSGWVGPYNSGQTGSASHSWSSSGTYDVRAKAKDNYGAESGWSPSLTVTINPPNIPPTAYIDSIEPNPAEEGEPVTFTGHGEDSDGTIIGYNWQSSVDGFLSSQPSFTRSSLTPGTHTIYFKVKDDDNDWSSEVSETLVIIGNQPPIAYIDSIEPNPAEEGEPVTFTGHGEDSDGTIIGYNWRSDKDGDLSIQASFTFSSLSQGTHTIYFKVKDNGDKWSDEISNTLEIIPSMGDPPEIPDIDGPSSGKAGVRYSYTATSTDPDDDKISYYWDWGDESSSEWLGPFNSGVPCEASHGWWEGSFVIKVKARDENGLESNWGELEVTMPRNKAIINMQFLNFLQSYPNIFLILKLFLQRLGLQC